MKEVKLRVGMTRMLMVSVHEITGTAEDMEFSFPKWESANPDVAEIVPTKNYGPAVILRGVSPGRSIVTVSIPDNETYISDMIGVEVRERFYPESVSIVWGHEEIENDEETKTDS